MSEGAVVETGATTWMVQAVFDPDGKGGDFAYTVGLADRDECELHVWCRPTDGSDPGADFMLSPRDAGGLLNRTAQQLLDGEVRIGSTFDVEFDGGLSKGSFTLGQPVDPDEVEAYGVAPGATVIPLRWSLHRPAPAPPQPLPTDVWSRVLDLSRRLRSDPASVTDAVELLAPAIRTELGAAHATRHAMARSRGYSDALARCVEEAASDAAELVRRSPELLEGISPGQRAKYADTLRQMVHAVIADAYGWLLLGDMPGPGTTFSAHRLLEAMLDPDAARARFWDLPCAEPISARAAQLTTDDVQRLAKEVDRLGSAFTDDLWWAIARCAAAGRGAPALLEWHHKLLVPAVAPGEGGEVLSAEQVRFAGYAISGAALSAVLTSRLGGDVVLVDDTTRLAESWQAVVG